MNIIDTHCDALLKLQSAKRGQFGFLRPLDFRSSEELETNLSRLKKGKVKLQFFAIFIHPHVPSDESWQHALEQIDVFHTEVIGKCDEMVHVKEWKEIESIPEGKIGAVLTLEGADAFGNDLAKLRLLYRMGILSIGMTWNNANLCADGAGEPRGGGLTLLGKEVVRLNNANHVLTDTAHSTVKGFWDMVELADYPFNSHANARTVCEHPRNLYDDQVEALVQKNGMIQVVFFPEFIKNQDGPVTITDLIRHIEHLCALGASEHIGFGSDFDGIDKHIIGLENAADYQNLINELLKLYPEKTVRGFAGENLLKRLPRLA